MNTAARNSPMASSPRSTSGFTLVELVVSMVITTILAGTIAMLIGAPVDSYLQQGRRNELAEASERITRTLSADLSHALPNSVRIVNTATTSVLQFLEVTDVVYFVSEPLGATALQAAQGLNFLLPDTDFIAYGTFTNSPPNPLLVVNNTGIGINDAYAMSAVSVRNAVPNTSTSPTNPVTLSPAFQFLNGVPATHRMFAVRNATTYVCNRTTGTLRRFFDHSIAAVIPTNESAAQLASATSVGVVATGITSCTLTCAAAAPGLPCQSAVTLTMDMTRGTAPNVSTVHVLHQVMVENTP